ncbi:MAG: ATP-binding protein, partial [Stackebrandtia sp.]
DLACPDGADSAAPQDAAAAVPASVPRQLPADVATFTGRREQLAALIEAACPSSPHASSASPRPPNTVVVSAVDGMGGVGKTALAVHAASQLADRFPDGQLFVDLHGFSGDVAPLDPCEALDRMLRDLGVAGKQIPADVEGKSAALRTAFAGKRALVLLDNAGDEEQVRPLLPGLSECAVIVTSRRRLAGLDDARLLSLDVLSPGEAIDLFYRVCGRAPGAGFATPVVAEIAELCGRLPLAIRVAAARLRSRPGWTLETLRDKLADEHRRLGELRAGRRSVDGAFALSCRDVDADARQTFFLVGLIPGADFTADAVAALTGKPVADAERLLEDLVDAHLVESPEPGRYRLHDLLRLYATQRAVELGESDRDAALRRLYDWYVWSAREAAIASHLLSRDWVRPEIPPAGFAVARFDDLECAIDWLDKERGNISATARAAAENRHGEVPWHLVEAVAEHFVMRDDLDGLRRAAEIALGAAEHAGDVQGQAMMHSRLGSAANNRQDFAAAIKRLSQAFALLGDDGDPRLLGRVLIQLAFAHTNAGELSTAAGYARRSVRAHRALDSDRLGSVLGFASVVVVELGRLGEAVDYMKEAENLHRRDSHPHRYIGLGNLAEAYTDLGELEAADECLAEALELCRRVEAVRSESSLLTRAAGLHLLRGQTQEAGECARRAANQARECGSRIHEARALSMLARSMLDVDRDAAEETARRAVETADAAVGARVAALSALSEAQTVRGRFGEAIENARQALDIARDGEYGVDEGKALTVLAEARLADGDVAGAITTAEEALASHRVTGHRPGEARTLQLLAGAHESLGDAAAAEHREAAAKLYAQMGLPPKE